MTTAMMVMMMSMAMVTCYGKSQSKATPSISNHLHAATFCELLNLRLTTSWQRRSETRILMTMTTDDNCDDGDDDDDDDVDGNGDETVG
jgi:hypothetical protein